MKLSRFLVLSPHGIRTYIDRGIHVSNNEFENLPKFQAESKKKTKFHRFRTVPEIRLDRRMTKISYCDLCNYISTSKFSNNDSLEFLDID